MSEENIIEIELENGKKVDGEILFTFEANGDNFILYTVKNKDGEEEAQAAKIDDNKKLYPVEEDEWPLVEKIFNQFMEEREEE